MNRATRGENLSVGKDSRPLADRMRPEHIAAVVGQEHLLGAGKPLRVAIESGCLHSMVLWGPPGTGKTTVARLLAQQCHAQFLTLSAVFGGGQGGTAAHRPHPPGPPGGGAGPA